jgi:outer membrane receptor protein involved in Fe transport
VARPQLRELAPFAFSDYFGGREVQGNPDLVNTSITNADLRFEFFPTPKEVIAVSTFFKHFEDPIEQVIQAAGARGVVTFENAKAARLFGVELEVRKSLDMFHEVLAPFSLIGNVTFARSTVDLDPETAKFVTNESRPMSLQAPYIVNAAIDFDEPDWGTRARVSYNVVGPRLAQVGTQGLPDVTEEPRHQLDLLIGQAIGEHVELRGSASNLIDSPIERTQGETAGKPNVVQKYRLGQTFTIGATVSY